MKQPNEQTLLGYADAAVAGDAAALENLLVAIKDPLFRLALRMLGNFADAEDATQEILVKITTGLASFQRRSGIRTWAFRVAVNHVRDFAAKRRTPTHSFDTVAEQLQRGIELTPNFAPTLKGSDPVLELEAREVGLHCLQGILRCLDIDQRTAYVLGDVFDFDAATAARILGIGEAAYRQRLSRARRRLEGFLGERCGLIAADAPCTCERQAQALRRVRDGKPIGIKFARGDDPVARDALERARGELKRLQRIALAFRRSPEWPAPEGMVDRVRALLKSSPLLFGGPST